MVSGVILSAQWPDIASFDDQRNWLCTHVVVFKVGGFEYFFLSCVVFCSFVLVSYFLKNRCIHFDTSSIFGSSDLSPIF